VNKADTKLQGYGSSAEKKLSEFSKETGNKLNSAVDKFDKNVEAGAAKSKSTISSWFGGK
jgi:hypothetical protein